MLVLAWRLVLALASVNEVTVLGGDAVVLVLVLATVHVIE